MKAFINGREFTFTKGETILKAAKRLGIFIPTLCAYLPLEHTPGTCRLCLVETEVDGKKQIVTSCTTPLKDGMRIETRTPKVREMQRMQMAWVFADHNQDCASCARHGNCELQDLALYVGLQHNGCNGRFTAKRPADWSANGLIRDADKCIRCARCVEVCRTIQGDKVSALTINDIGTMCGVGITGAERWADSPTCVQCGQCALVCPTGALGEKDETEQAIDWLADPEIKTIVAFAPAVRVTLGENFGVESGVNLEGKIITALKMMGADYVCDINWGADVTIMEEGSELLERLTKKGTLPMMTSCCPGWVNFVEKIHPEMIPNLSTTRSPQGIFGSLAKTWFAKEHGIDPKKLRFISIMPCTAKKDEIKRPQLMKGYEQDTDLVLTVREFTRLLQRQGINLAKLEESTFDSPFMSENTGAGVIFGATGGVMEAALRTVYFKATGRELGPVDYEPARGMAWIKSAEVDLEKFGKVKIAVVHGLANAEKVCADIAAGKCAFDFIEVMACPGGCIGGGGNMRVKNNYMNLAEKRIAGIYAVDKTRQIRQSHNNPDVIRLYKEFLVKPLSHTAEDLLHTHYTDRKKGPQELSIRNIWQRVKLG